MATDAWVASAPPGEPSPPAPSPPPVRRLRALLVGSVVAIALALFLFVGLGHGSGHGGRSGTGPVVPVGSTAPDFTLPALTRTTPVHLDAVGRDRHRPVILNFFASWCIPCRQETPLLARTAVAEQAKGGGSVAFVGVDVADNPANAVPFVTRSGITYPVAVDADYVVAGNRYGLYGMPSTFFISASGVVLGHTFGPVDQTVLDGWLRRLGGSPG